MSAGRRCPSCGRPTARRLPVCPYCGERMPGGWRGVAAPALAVAGCLAVVALSAARLTAGTGGAPLRRIAAALRGASRSPGAMALLAVAAVAILAPAPRPLPGAASCSRGRRAAVLALRLLALAAATLAVAAAR